MAEDFQEQVHSLQGFEIPEKRENVYMISIAHEQNVICSKTIICKQLFAGHVANEKEGENTPNDNNNNWFVILIIVSNFLSPAYGRFLNSLIFNRK